MRRAATVIAVLACLTMALTGCAGDSQQKVLTEGARAARSAASAVNTVRVTSQQLLGHQLWSQSAIRMVKDSEDALSKVSDSFGARQPATADARETDDRFTEALDAASSAVRDTRIAMVNNDLGKVREQLAVLTKVGDQLGELGQSAK